MLRNIGRLRGGGGAASFDPYVLLNSTSYVWDASDASTITKNASNQVSQIRDKSGNGNHLNQATDAKKPVTGVQINGVDALDCRTDKYMLPTTEIFASAVQCEVFAVIWSDRALTDDNAYIVARPTSSTANRNIFTAKTQFGGTSLLGSTVTRGNGTMRHTLIQHSYTDGTTGTVNQGMWIDGRTRTGTSSVTGVGGTGGVFGSSTGATTMNGLFGEMWVFNGKTLTDTERTNMRNWLAAKWRALTPVSKYHIVVIAGQSNARGAWGPVNRVEDLTDPRIAMLERTYNATTGVVIEDANGEIVLAEHPLSNRWRDTASPPPEDTVGFGMAYAKALLATLPSDEGVLLVPCAQGATYVMPLPPTTSDVTWHPVPQSGRSNAPYTDTIARANRMIALGHQLHSIVWLQGEQEAAQVTMAQATYAGYMDAVLNGLRNNITGASAIPLVAGQIGHFLSGTTYPNMPNVNAAIADLPNRLAHTAYVDTTGLTDGGDGLHYDAASQRTLGGMFWTAYGTIT